VYFRSTSGKTACQLIVHLGVIGEMQSFLTTSSLIILLQLWPKQSGVPFLFFFQCDPDYMYVIHVSDSVFFYFPVANTFHNLLYMEVTVRLPHSTFAVYI